MKELWRPGNMLYPLPAVMVTCKDNKNNKTNIITVAWAGTICSDPAMVSISVRKERYSHDLILNNKEFVINLVTKDLIKACDWCGVRSGAKYDKFKEMGLHEATPFTGTTPLIEESPVNIECKVEQVLELGSHDMFIAKITGVVIDNKYMDENNKFCLNNSNLITYSHGEYFTLGEKVGTFGYSVRKK